MRRRLVWLAEVPYSGPPHRQQHLARLLASQFEVLFVEPPQPLRPPRVRVARTDGLCVAQVAPLLNARPLRRVLGRPAARRLAQTVAGLQMRRALGAAGLAKRHSDLLVVCSNVYLIDAARALRPRQLLVDICDDPRYFPGEPPWTGDLLRTAVTVADVVTTSSRSLEAEFRALGARHVAYVPNGIHRAFLDAASAASTLHRPALPTLGFVGHCGAWVDVELLERLARDLPEQRLEVVGSVAPAVRADCERLLHLPNVHYRPAVPYAAVPDVLAHLSVGLIPFRTSAYARAVNPIKLYEYAAANLPIVSTAFSQDVAQFAPPVDVCATPAEFVRRAGERATAPVQQPTRPIAEAHTWEHIGRALQALLESHGT